MHGRRFFSPLTTLSSPRKPWGHMVQVGDPVLRKTCQEVPREKIQGREVQNIIAHMEATLKR